jgi:hypothetical protein
VKSSEHMHMYIYVLYSCYPLALVVICA